jgi:hypothetical protein
MQITVSSNDSNKPTEIITVLAPVGDTGWKYTDVDGDRIAVYTSDINGAPGVYFRTDPNGCSIPVTDLEAFIEGLRETAQRATTALEGSK